MNGIWLAVGSSPEPTIRTTAARNTLDGDVERLQHASCEAFFFAQQAEQEVLGGDAVVPQFPRLFLG